METTTHPRRRVMRYPHVGDLVDTRVGLARITAVHDHGRRLTVATIRHGAETIERAADGSWTVYRWPAPDAGRNGLVWLVTSIGPSSYDGHVHVAGAIIDSGEHRDNFSWNVADTNHDRAYVIAD